MNLWKSLSQHGIVSSNIVRSLFYFTTVAVIKQWPEAVWRRKGFIWLTGYSPLLKENKKAGTPGRNWIWDHRRKLLTGFPQLAQFVIQDHLPKGGTAYSGLCSPTPIINQGKSPRCARRSICCRHFLSWGSFFSDV